MQHSTLKRLSETLGVSISTVSRALKGHPNVSDITRAKVKQLATAMEYEPNDLAIKLRTRKSNLLGVLVPSVDNFFYDSFIAAVETEARLNGYSLLIMQSRDNLDIETSCLQLFRKNMVLGVFAAISTEIEDLAPFRKLKELEIPVVFFDRVPLADGYDKVCLADEKAAQMAAEAIITEKKKSVLALFGHPHLSISRIRCASFKETFLKKSPGTKLHIDYPEGIVESKRLALVELKTKGKYDVVFCMGDLILIGVMHAIHELKLRVPDDISVISISNGLIPTMYNPRITYVETSGFKLGKLAYSQMLSCLKEQHEPEEVILESVLVKGGSL